MDDRIPILLASDREDVTRALSPGDGTGRFRVDSARVDGIDASSSAGEYGVALLDLVPNTPRAMALSRRLRSANGQLEVIAIVADERSGFEAVRAGAFDFVVWPLLDVQSLWTVVTGCARKLSPVSSYTPAALGRWRIVKRLGAGGMAEVFLAEQPGSPEPVVVKCLLPEIALEPEFVEMFTAEARLSAMLDHPNVVKVLDFGGADGQLFMVMEYVEGRNLEQILRNAVRLPPALACWVAAEIARGLGYAHSKTDAAGKPLSIIHRDVNPPNILVSDGGRVKLTDFGIAKTSGARTQTTHGAMKGKLDYMSPEQVEGSSIDGRADLFALGSVLYLLLSGVHPFRATTALQTLQKIRAARCEPPSAAHPQVPKSLDPILMRALARDPAQRYARAADFEGELRAWVVTNGDPVGEAALASFVHGIFAPDPARDAIARVPTRKVTLPPEGGDGTTRMPKVTNLVPTAVVPVEASSGGTTLPRESTVVSVAAPTVAESTVISTQLPEDTFVGADSLRRPRGDTVVRANAVPDLPEDTVSNPIARPPVPVATRAPREDTVSAPEAATWNEVSEERGTITHGEAVKSPFAFRRKDPTSKPRPWGMYSMVAGFVMVIAIGVLSRPRDPSRLASASPVTTREETPEDTPQATPEATPERTPERTPVATVRTPIPTPARTAVALSTPVRTATPRPTPNATPKALRKGTLSIWLVGGWASISIDGKATGMNAPLVGLEVAEGKHRVTLENAGLGFRRDYDVVIQPGRESKLTVSLSN